MPSRSANTRHGYLPGCLDLSKKEIRQAHEIWYGQVKRFSVTKTYTVTIRAAVKMTFIGEEFSEELIYMEMAPDESVRILSRMPEAPVDATWHPNPPIQVSELEKRLSAMLNKAKKLAESNAEQVRRLTLVNLHKTLIQMKRYYAQLKQDSLFQKNPGSCEIFDNEYETRKHEEVEYAGVTVRLEVVAAETFSRPSKKIIWEVENNTASKKISINAAYPEDISISCESCKKQSTCFAVSGDGKILCAHCLRPEDQFSVKMDQKTETCSSCFVSLDKTEIKICRTCGQVYCPDCIRKCETCLKPFCINHIKERMCKQCRIQK